MPSKAPRFAVGAILDAAYTNDTFDLLSLAKALIQKQVTLQGAFMRVC